MWRGPCAAFTELLVDVIVDWSPPSTNPKPSSHLNLGSSASVRTDNVLKDMVTEVYLMSHPSGQKVFIIANGRRIKVSLSKQVAMPESTMAVPWPDDFPVELYYHVFKYLPQADLARSCRVNTYCPCCRWDLAD
jgi:hypothetical protein